jgi:hypothetical protein
MTDYPYDLNLVVDPLNPANVVAEGEVTLYDPTDTDFSSPLALEDLHGLPLGNPLTSSPTGFLQEFVATIPQVKWKSGPYEGLFNSYKGLRDEAVAAREAAEAALLERGIKSGGTTGQVLTKVSDLDYSVEWRSPVVIIGPEDPWPTGLPEGTLVVRTEA